MTNHSNETLSVPGTDPVYSAPVEIAHIGRILAKVQNNTDKQIAVAFELTTIDDPAFAAPVAGTSQNVTAGTVAALTNADAYAYARVKVTAAEVPTAGGTVTVSWGLRHGRD